MKLRLLLGIIMVAALAGCGGAEERKAVYLEKAKSSIALGDFDKARIELKNVLQIDPKDSEAYFQLGNVNEQLKQYRKAYSNYKKAETLDPDNLANLARLGRIYLLLANDPEKAQEKVDYILGKEPGNPDGLLLKAAIILKQNKLAEAIDITKSVIANDPGNIEAIVFLTTMYIREKSLDQAVAVLDAGLTVKKDNDKLNSLLATILVNTKDYERAESIFKHLLEKNPDSRNSYDTLAKFYIETGNKPKAEEVLKASIDSDPSDVERQLTYVKYIRASQGGDAAIEKLKGLIEENSGLGKLRLALGELYTLEKNQQQALAVFNRAIKDFPDDATGVDARIAIAIIHLGNKDYDKASEFVEQAITVSPNNPKVNLLRAKLAIFNDDLETAIIALQIVTKGEPENIEAYFLLAGAYQKEGKQEMSDSVINSAYLNNKGNADALMILAKYYLQKDTAKAEKIIDDYNALKQKDYEGMSIKAASLNQRKQYEEAYKIAEVLMQDYPDKANGYIQSIQYLIDQGKRGDAISNLEKGYLNVAENRKILTLLVSLEVVDKRFDTAEKRVKTELASNPDDAELKLILTRLYLSSEKTAEAEKLLNEIIATNPEVEQPYILLAKIYKFKKQDDLIKPILEKGRANVTPGSQIRVTLARVYEVEESYQKAIDVYRELNTLVPDNLIIINNYASLLSEYGKNKEDMDLAISLSEKLQDSEQSVFKDTIGWVYYKSGDYDKALVYLKQAVEKSPDVNIFNFHLGMAYEKAGDKVNAKKYLEKSLENKQPFKEKSQAESALKNL